MTRAAAVNFARTGAQKLWAGTVQIHPNAKTGAHHHGHLESVIYVLKGRARMRWGEKLEFTAEAGEGDFIYVPPYGQFSTHLVHSFGAWRSGGGELFLHGLIRARESEGFLS